MISFKHWLLVLLISTFYAIWFYQLKQTVPQPYLDEVFHIRQAQAYCAGQFHIWDPKITTPPGIYIISYLSAQLFRPVLGEQRCEVAFLRALNTIIGLFVLPLQVRDLYRYRHGQASGEAGQDDHHIWHTALNMSFFPLLFFFSGLYYTDVCSVSLVLAAYQYYCRSGRDTSTWRFRDGLMMFLIGLCALLMRQTNIFWVAVLLAGFHAVQCVKRLEIPSTEDSISSQHNSGEIFDLPVGDAYLEGMR